MPVIIQPSPGGGSVTISDSAGVPAGGADGQYLRKASAANYDTEWSDSTTSWGDIDGTLSTQPDLQAALDAKLDDSQLDTDTTLAANSDAKIATQKAVKAYVDASGGGSTWVLVDQSGDPIEVEDASWTWSTNVTEVAFTGLDDASELLVYAHGVAVSVSGAAMVQVSTNGGSSYYTTSGDYLAIAQTGTAANTIGSTFWSTNSTAARYGTVTILNPTVVGPKFMPSFPSDSTPLRIFVAELSNPINAIRVVGSAGGNITAGKLYVYKK